MSLSAEYSDRCGAEQCGAEQCGAEQCGADQCGSGLVRLPDWLRRPPGSSRDTADLKRLLRKSRLHTVCEEARCPNISECFSRGTATFRMCAQGGAAFVRLKPEGLISLRVNSSGKLAM